MVLGGFGWFWMVLGGFGCFSNYAYQYPRKNYKKQVPLLMNNFCLQFVYLYEICFNINFISFGHFHDHNFGCRGSL